MTHPMRADGRCLSIAEIKAWRTKRHENGEPSGLLDYFREHDLCPTCKGLGTTVVYHGIRPIDTKICNRCNGDCRWTEQ